MGAINPQFEISVLDAARQGERSATYWLPRIMALAAAFVGPLPLVLDMRFHIGMSQTAPVLWTASVALAVGASMLAYRWGDRSVARAVLVAVVAGYMATATYDSTRIAGMSAGVTAMDEAQDFGLRLTAQIGPGGHAQGDHGGMQTAPGKGHANAGQDQGHQPKPGDQGTEAHSQDAGTASPTTVALGYAWHYWAGIMFALGYLVIFGARRWWVAIPYTVLLIYSGMVLTMGFHSMANFIWEAVGHAGFGLTLGIVSWALLARD